MTKGFLARGHSDVEVSGRKLRDQFARHLRGHGEEGNGGKNPFLNWCKKKKKKKKKKKTLKHQETKEET